MLTSRLWCTLVAVVAMVVACVPPVFAQQPVPPDMSGARTVGVISAVGNLQLHHVGTTVFSNHDATGDIADWNLDAEVVADIRGALGDHYTVKAVKYEESYFDSAPEYGAKDKIAEAVRKQAERDGAEAYDLIWWYHLLPKAIR